MTTKPEPRSADSSAAAGSGWTRLRIAVRRASDGIDQAASSARTLGSQLSATAQTTRSRANATTTALQTLPHSTLRGLAMSSLGLGAGFYLARGSRLATAAAVAPAMVIGAAIILRPVDQAMESETSGGGGPSD
jgi:hypothetical protein